MKVGGFTWRGQLGRIVRDGLKCLTLPLAAALAISSATDLQAATVVARGGGGGGNRASFSARSGVGVARFGSGNFGRMARVNPMVNQNRMMGRNAFFDNRFHRFHHHNRFAVVSPFLYSYPYYSSYPYYPSYPSLYSQYYQMPLDYPDYPSSYADSYQGSSSLSMVQTALARQGYYAGSVDGVMGPLTREALRNFQRDNNLTVSGLVNNAVLGRLGLL